MFYQRGGKKACETVNSGHEYPQPGLLGKWLMSGQSMAIYQIPAACSFSDAILDQSTFGTHKVEETSIQLYSKTDYSEVRKQPKGTVVMPSPPFEAQACVADCEGHIPLTTTSGPPDL